MTSQIGGLEFPQIGAPKFGLFGTIVCNISDRSGVKYLGFPNAVGPKIVLSHFTLYVYICIYIHIRRVDIG